MVGLIIPGNLEPVVKFEIVFAMSALILKKFGVSLSNCYENILYKFSLAKGIIKSECYSN